MVILHRNKNHVSKTENNKNFESLKITVIAHILPQILQNKILNKQLLFSREILFCNFLEIMDVPVPQGLMEKSHFKTLLCGKINVM